MIPTMILFGLVFGRWWRIAVAASAVLWPALVLVYGAIDSVSEIIGAAGLGVGNAAIGVLVHQAVLQTYRRWPIG